LSGRQPVKIHGKPKIQSSSLVVAWDEDAGYLGQKVIDYLIQRLGGEEFGEIEPEDFFSLGDVQVEGDVAQFPESKFFICPENDLAIFKSAPPQFEWYKFLNSILDVAEHYCHAKELYTIGGMVTLAAHTAPRVLLATTNSPEAKEMLSQYNLASDMDYQTPPGQRPTLSSFLLWVAKGRNIPGVSLWVPIPLYLVENEDPQAQKEVLQFFDERFALNLDFKHIDRKIQEQNEKLAQARLHLPEADDCIRRLESNLKLSQEESETLANAIEEFFREGETGGTGKTK
jgi:proteasome assembly chaperone (PAC2) family protein